MTKARAEAPELLALKRRLSISTSIDPIELSDWIRANMDWLRDGHNDVPNTHPDYQHEAYAWVRLQFLQRERRVL